MVRDNLVHKFDAWLGWFRHIACPDSTKVLTGRRGHEAEKLRAIAYPTACKVRMATHTVYVDSQRYSCICRALALPDRGARTGRCKKLTDFQQLPA